MSQDRTSSPSARTYVLVTGANSGLGFATCCRLIDEFLNSRPQTHQLTLIFTTRDDKKGNATLVALKKHLSKHRVIRANLSGPNPRVYLRPENLELTSLLSVRALSQRLLRSAIPKLDAIILNAGVGGFVGLNWPGAIWRISTELIQATTWPTYKLSASGLITQPQLPPSKTATHEQEPVLGQIFCANVFGHYMLAHWLMSMLRACPPTQPGRIIWVSSIETQSYHFNKHDIQALESRTPYEHTKCMTDLLALTAPNQAATSKSVQSFLAHNTNDRRLTHTPYAPSEPTIHTAQPGICATSIVPLPFILQMLMILTFHIARLLGSPWHNVSAYTGAVAPVWLALADTREIADREKVGAAKWGSAVSRLGRESVERTDVPGWGICGDGGVVEWWYKGWRFLGGGGRKRGGKDAKKEDVERFVEEGALVWRELERLRIEWEGRIKEFESGEKS